MVRMKEKNNCTARKERMDASLTLFKIRNQQADLEKEELIKKKIAHQDQTSKTGWSDKTVHPVSVRAAMRSNNTDLARCICTLDRH